MRLLLLSGGGGCLSTYPRLACPFTIYSNLVSQLLALSRVESDADGGKEVGSLLGSCHRLRVAIFVVQYYSELFESRYESCLQFKVYLTGECSEP